MRLTNKINNSLLVAVPVVTASVFLFHSDACADCPCYRPENSDYEYALDTCAVEYRMCDDHEEQEINERSWEYIPFGEWPAGYLEHTCEYIAEATVILHVDFLSAEFTLYKIKDRILNCPGRNSFMRRLIGIEIPQQEEKIVGC